MPFGSFPWGHFDRKIVIDPCKFYDRSKDLLVWYETGSKINDNFIKEFYKTVAILSALGYDRIVVTLYPNRYPPILEKDIENWPYVRSGLISRTDASKLFQLYFILNGRERTNS